MVDFHADSEFSTSKGGNMAEGNGKVIVQDFFTNESKVVARPANESEAYRKRLNIAEREQYDWEIRNDMLREARLDRDRE